MRVRYYGHVGQRTGYGRAAEATCHALLAAGADLDIRPLAPLGQLDLTRPSVLPLASRFGGLAAPDVVMVHTLPLDTARVLSIERLARGQGPRLVAYTTWEGSSQMPDSFGEAFSAFDAVCFPSRHNLDRRPLPVGELRSIAFVVPHAIDHMWRPVAASVPVPHKFEFYYVGAWSGRKNPCGLIRAFVSEFDRDENVSLTLHCAGASPAELACAMTATGLPQSKHPHVRFFNQSVSDTEIAIRHATPGCFVSATRGEAWNYPAFDAMMARRAMIVTDMMGHDDFLSYTSARRLQVQGRAQLAEADVSVAEPVPGQSDGTLNLRVAGAQGLDCRATWVEPDLCSLAANMRGCFQYNEITLSVNYDPVERYSALAVGTTLLKNLESL